MSRVVKDTAKEIHTDLVIGDFDKVVGWNWNTPLPSSTNKLDWLPALSRDMGLYREFVSVGLRGFNDGGPIAFVDPWILEEKFSSIGEREFGSKLDLAGELRKPSSPSPEMCPPFG